MEEKNEKSKKGLIVTLVVIIVLLLGACGYLLYDKVLSNNDKNEDSDIVQENNNLVLSYEVKSETSSCKRLYINGKKTEFVGKINDVVSETDKFILLKGANGAKIKDNICSEDWVVINPSYYIITGDGTVYTFVRSSSSSTKETTSLTVKGEMIISAYFNSGGIVVESYNGGHDPIGVIENMTDKTVPFEFREYFTYNKDGTFTSEIWRSTTAQEYYNLHKNDF